MDTNLETVYGELLGRISELSVVDTHEHLPNESDFLAAGVDVFTLFRHYTRADLVAAGMPERDAFERLQDKSIPLEKRWEMLEPYWPVIRHGEYARSLLISLKELLGFDDITSANYLRVSEAISKTAQPGLYEDVLRRRCRIEWVLNFVDHTPESVRSRSPEFLLPVPTLDALFNFRDRASLAQLERTFEIELVSFEAYETFLENVVRGYARWGAKGVKLAIAYWRSLRVERAERAEAARAFNSLFSGYGEGISQNQAFPLQNYAIRRLVELATEHSLPVVIHTGVQNDHYHYLEHARATHLTSLFRDYPRACFVLLHGGFPWVEETGYLAKIFPNVYLSMAWMHIMSAELSRHALRVWLDTVPVNKIMAFGGDYMVPYKVYGHLRLAREVVARVLAERVSHGRMSSSDALDLARMWFYDVPRRVFKLP